MYLILVIVDHFLCIHLAWLLFISRKYAESAKYLEQQENKHRVLQELQSHPKTRVSLASPDQHGPSDNDVSFQNHFSKGNNTQKTSGMCSEPVIETDTTVAQMQNALALLKVTASACVQTCDQNEELGEDHTMTIKNSGEDKSKKCPSPCNTMKPLSREGEGNIQQPPKVAGQYLLNWMSEDNHQPIECDEWLVFLRKTMEEVMEGEVDVMTQENFVAMLVAPLRNPHASSKVIEYVADLLSLPFVVCGVTEEVKSQIKDVSLLSDC